MHAIGLSQAQRNDSPRGVILAGLIIGVVATLISFSQYFVVGKYADKLKSDKWSNKVEEIVNDVQENVVRDLEDANVSIKVEDGDEKSRDKHWYRQVGQGKNP